MSMFARRAVRANPCWATVWVPKKSVVVVGGSRVVTGAVGRNTNRQQRWILSVLSVSKGTRAISPCFSMMFSLSAEPRKLRLLVLNTLGAGALWLFALPPLPPSLCSIFREVARQRKPEGKSCSQSLGHASHNQAPHASRAEGDFSLLPDPTE